jgi:hypothetical protein
MPSGPAAFGAGAGLAIVPDQRSESASPASSATAPPPQISHAG